MFCIKKEKMANLTRILLLACFSVLSESTDLTGSVFTFPRSESVDHVTLSPHDRTLLSQASLCLRFYTDQTGGDPCFFSLATTDYPSGFVLCRMYWRQFRIRLGSKVVDFLGFQYRLNGWNSVCATWDEEHITQFFINGEASVKQLAPLKRGWQIPTNHSIIMGQSQEKYKQGYRTEFTGHIADVHMWDHVISTCEVLRFMKEMSFQPGNYLSWHNLSFEAHGKVKVEKKQLFSTDTTC